jgi:hypothetical protein
MSCQQWAVSRFHLVRQNFAVRNLRLGVSELVMVKEIIVGCLPKNYAHTSDESLKKKEITEVE